MVDDLPQKLHFRPPSRRCFSHFGQNVGFWPHALVPAGIRDDTEAAELVTSLDDGDVRADSIAAPREAEGKGHVVVRIEVDGGRARGLPPLALAPLAAHPHTHHSELNSDLI